MPTTSNGTPLIRVEVVYALPEQQPLIELNLPAGACVEDAILQSGLLQRFPELLDARLPWHKRVGILGRRCVAQQLLSDHDRIEIYRPLLLDPKEARRQRAKAG